jgi:hypothetical protein
MANEALGLSFLLFFRQDWSKFEIDAKKVATFLCIALNQIIVILFVGFC